MKIDELRHKTQDELKELVIQYRRELMNLRFQRTTSQLTSSAQFRQTRRKVAQIKTVIHQNNIKVS